MSWRSFLPRHSYSAFPTVGRVSSEPHLTSVSSPASVRAALLVLHGGQEVGHEMVGATSASWLRARVLAQAISGPARDAEVAIRLLRYRKRGWNGGEDPVPDARWALERVRRELGDVPVVLLGHSMGARTAVHVADDPRVRGVVALAPWFPPGEPVDALAGRQLRAAHGRADEITSFEATRAFVERSRAVTELSHLHDMGEVGHYLLRRASAWHRFALEAAVATLGPTGAHGA